ncbi:MAG: hypothetical protein A2Z21_10360 [Candidatus Fraserbacteria bacterium RBG_16_55_9]|uniref:Aminoglycoside phosphotransferase domain-containing protein n=1 Tax=Fraserbacteria sp. (strain RBG_16_55_9) TaxID=1817864 RepID=A0A1F5URQ8_FRAXR|nr:MAG: hypothetical protein A2Z21_10360 [Candidatus Fraserbacteria bacterium RBG_16_55_9]
MDIPVAYLDRIRACRPDLIISAAHLNHDGLVNDVVIVNNELVFRFAKGERAKQSLIQEAKIVELVRCYVALPVPIFEKRGDDFVVYRIIPGDALHREDILRQDESTQDRLAEQISRFLQQLHSIPRRAIEEHGIAPSDSVRNQQDWIRLFQDVERELFPLLMIHAQEWVTRHFAPVLDGSLDLNYDPVLIHGDLGPYHILYDPTVHKINGVIDFGTSGLGDPADDFAAIIHALGESFLLRMSKFYPEIRTALDRARFWAGTLELQWALHGIRSNDVSWFVCHIGRARDVMPIRAA